MFNTSIFAEIKSESGRVHRYAFPSDTPQEEVYHILTMIRTDVFNQIKESEDKEKVEQEAKAKEASKKKPFSGSNYEECAAHCGSKEEEEALLKKQKEEIADVEEIKEVEDDEKS